MGRHRSVSDREILDATARVLVREGPLRFTLADIGEEVGLTAPAIIKRFESKRALLIAVNATARGNIAGAFERRGDETALGALHRALLEQAHGFSTPREVANGLAFFELDITDETFHVLAVEFFASFRGAIRLLLDGAVERKELRECDTAALARAVEVAYNGSLLSWSIWQQGTSSAALAQDVEAVLTPFRRTRKGRGAPMRTRRPRLPS